jgi:hypothetical protein
MKKEEVNFGWLVRGWVTMRDPLRFKTEPLEVLVSVQSWEQYIPPYNSCVPCSVSVVEKFLLKLVLLNCNCTALHSSTSDLLLESANTTGLEIVQGKESIVCLHDWNIFITNYQPFLASTLSPLSTSPNLSSQVTWTFSETDACR